MNKQEREAKISELRNSVEEHKKQIELLESQISDLVNATVCPNCGEDLDEDALFCAACGTRIVKESEVSSDKCPQCEAPIKPGMKFCIRCGFKLEESVTSTPEVPPVRKCPNCGTELKDDSLFCYMCGTKV